MFVALIAPRLSLLMSAWRDTKRNWCSLSLKDLRLTLKMVKARLIFLTCRRFCFAHSWTAFLLGNCLFLCAGLPVPTRDQSSGTERLPPAQMGAHQMERFRWK